MGEKTATDTNTMSAAIRTPRSVRALCSSRDSTGPLITPIPAGAKTTPRGDRSLARARFAALRLELVSERPHLALEDLDLARLRLERGDRHAGVAVEVDHVAPGIDRRARRDVVDDEAELRARGGGRLVAEGSEAKLHELVVETARLRRAEVADVLLRVPARDRAPAAVRRVAGGADEELVAVGARIAGGALGGAGRARRLASGAGRGARRVALAAAHRVAAGVVQRGHT